MTRARIRANTNAAKSVVTMNAIISNAMAISAMAMGAIAISACEDKTTARPDPPKAASIASTSASPSASIASTKASASAKATAPATIAVNEARCRDGARLYPAPGLGETAAAPPAPSPTAAASASGGLADAGSLLGDVPALGMGGPVMPGHGYGLGPQGGGRIGGPVFLRLELVGQSATFEVGRYDVDDVVCAAFPKFSDCFEPQALGDGPEYGTIGLALTIGKDGKVTDAKPVGGDITTERVHSCLTAAGKELSFSPGEKVTTATYAFRANGTPTKKGPKLKEPKEGMKLTGALPPEVVKRIVRANFPRFRACYQKGLMFDPALAGTVTTKFVIDPTGAVESPANEGGTLASPQVKACVLGVYRTLSFPEPEKGKVTVSYSIEFAPPD
jgi:hypothetical protein